MSDQLRSKVIRLAASMPKGSSEREALLGVLSKTGAFEPEETADLEELYKQARRIAQSILKEMQKQFPGWGPHSFNINKARGRVEFNIFGKGSAGPWELKLALYKSGPASDWILEAELKTGSRSIWKDMVSFGGGPYAVPRLVAKLFGRKHPKGELVALAAVKQSKTDPADMVVQMLSQGDRLFDDLEKKALSVKDTFTDGQKQLEGSKRYTANGDFQVAQAHLQKVSRGLKDISEYAKDLHEAIDKQLRQLPRI